MTAEVQADRADGNDTAAIALALVCAALALRIYFFLQVVLPLNHDGCMYLGAARAVVAGQSPIGDISAHVPPRTHSIPEYMYPPTLAIVLTPLALLPPAAADVAWLAIVAASCGLLAFLLGRWIGLVPAALLTLGFVPTWDTLWLGQINGVIACLVAIAIVATEASRERAAGVALAAGTLIKLTPAFAAVTLLTRRRPAGMVAAAATGLGVLAASLLIVSPADWWRGLTIASAQDPVSPYLVSWTAPLSRALGMRPALVMAALGGVLLIVTLIRARSIPFPQVLAAASLIPMLAGTMVWPHHAVTALPAIAVLWQRELGRPLGTVPLVAWLAMNFFTATPFVMPVAITAVWLALLLGISAVSRQAEQAA